MKTANPYLNFNGNTEEAFNFYKSVFGGEFVGLMRYKDFNDMEGMGELSEEDRNKIGHIGLPLGNNLLMGTDILESFGQPLVVGNNTHITLEPDTAHEADTVFAALSTNGEVEMPLQQTEWAEKYGACADQFGVRWMVNYGGNVEEAFTAGQAEHAAG